MKTAIVLLVALASTAINQASDPPITCFTEIASPEPLATSGTHYPIPLNDWESVKNSFLSVGNTLYAARCENSALKVLGYVDGVSKVTLSIQLPNRNYRKCELAYDYGKYLYVACPQEDSDFICICRVNIGAPTIEKYWEGPFCCPFYGLAWFKKENKLVIVGGRCFTIERDKQLKEIVTNHIKAKPRCCYYAAVIGDEAISLIVDLDFRVYAENTEILLSTPISTGFYAKRATNLGKSWVLIGKQIESEPPDDYETIILFKPESEGYSAAKWSNTKTIMGDILPMEGFVLAWHAGGSAFTGDRTITVITEKAIYRGPVPEKLPLGYPVRGYSGSRIFIIHAQGYSIIELSTHSVQRRG